MTGGHWHPMPMQPRCSMEMKENLDGQAQRVGHCVRQRAVCCAAPVHLHVYMHVHNFKG